MEGLLEMIERVARSQVGVLVQGETGTGKELVARALHLLGGRVPYVTLNCAALPEALVESELFGHERGAFTGADRARLGLIAQASGGTLFLDEVSETSPAIQAKLLRFLQEKEVRSLGSASTRRVDVRIVAATNVDLRQAIAQGRFREDLFHRIAVVPIDLPPLRERAGDVPILAEHFLAQLASDEGKALRGFHRSALRALERYEWPGNVRELRNEMQRIAVCANDGDRVCVEALSPRIAREASPSDVDTRALRDVLRQAEEAAILSRLREHGFRRTATARSLGISREALWAKLRRLGCAPAGRGKTSDGSAAPSAHSVAWHTASTWCPSGSATNAP